MDEFTGLPKERFFERGTSGSLSDEAFGKLDDVGKRDAIDEITSTPEVRGLYAQEVELKRKRNYCGGSYFGLEQQAQLEAVEAKLRPHKDKVFRWSRMLDEQLAAERDAEERALLRPIKGAMRR